MRQLKIKIGSKSYPIKFGFDSIKILAEMWGVKTPQMVYQKSAKVFVTEDGLTDYTFDQYDAIAEIILAGILSETPDADIKLSKIVDVFSSDLDLFKEIVSAFTASAPVPEKSESKVKNVKRVRK